MGMNEKADPKLVQEFLFKTITALRMFVNDELNQLDFAIRNIARHFLKPEVGTLAVIAHNEAEQKVVHKALTEIQYLKKPWQIIYGDPPLPLSPGEQILNPRFKN